MEGPLFREKSLERISSPEELHDYMRVTSPRLWMLLAAIMALLAGFIVYASTVTMENTMPIQVTLESFAPEADAPEEEKFAPYSLVNCELPTDLQGTVKAGTRVRMGEYQGRVTFIVMTEGEETMNAFIEMEDDHIPMKDGTYDAELVIDNKTPISYLWN